MDHNLVRTIDDLPALKEEHARLVHLTHFSLAESIAESGLRYNLMVSSTVRIYSDVRDVAYTSMDPRFSGDHIRAVVLDVPFDELKLHDMRIPQAPPGLVPAKYVVGVVKAEKTDSELASK